jgi:hypothetical protein
MFGRDISAERRQEMNIRLKIISLLISTGLLLFLLDLVRRKKLKERYSLLWLLMCGSFIALALRPIAVDRFIAEQLRVYEVPNLFFLSAVIFLVVLCIHFSMRISVLGEQVKTLAQELALIKRNADRMRQHP